MNTHTYTTMMTANQKEQNAARKLEYYVNNYRIFMDTCVFLHSDYELFMSKAEPYLRKYDASIIVPARVLDELERVGKRLPERRAAAQKARARIQQYVQAKLVRVLGEAMDDRVADSLFLAIFTRFRMKYNLMLITNDVDLAANIESLGSCSSLNNIRHVSAQRITRYGYLQPVVQAGSSSSGSTSEASVGNQKSEGFAVGQNAIVGNGSPIPVTLNVTEGSWLTARVGQRAWPVQLGKHVAAGGEGSIYETSCPGVAKIYMPSTNTTMKRDKLTLMLSRRVVHPGVCFPQAMLYNERNEFVGYLMPRAKGHPLQHLLFNRAYLQQQFPHWKKKDTVKLCVTILQLFRFLHEKNIILGDINPNNILVESPEKVYLVDTDSYQVENYPCPVGTTHFTAPEILGRNYAEFLRTMGHERFAVATLLFMIMMMGKSPYSRQGGGNLVENIRRGEFSYPMGEVSNRQAPEGDWRYMWSHLSRPVKEAFYNSFHHKGDNREESKRLDDKEWIRLFHNYQHGLENGMTDRDAMSGELFPTRHKRSDLVPQMVCRSCGATVPAFECRGGVCHDCARSSATNAVRPVSSQPRVVYANPAPRNSGPAAQPQQESLLRKVIRVAESIFS